MTRNAKRLELAIVHLELAIDNLKKAKETTSWVERRDMVKDAIKDAIEDQLEAKKISEECLVAVDEMISRAEDQAEAS
jgi:hypothetical protein